MKFIEFFDRTYIINLPERRDRRQGMAKELKRMGLPLTPGKVEIFPAVRPQDPGLFEGIGVRGAFLSHLGVLQKAKAEGARNVLVMEDDLAIHPDFSQYEATLLTELQQMDWDIVNFGYLNDGETGLRDTANFKPHLSANLVQFPLLRSFEGEKVGAHFYAVNGKTLEPLIQLFETLLESPLSYLEGGAIPADGVFNVFKWKYPQRHRLIAVPSFGGQRSSRSDISPSWFDNVPILKHVAEVARGVLQA
ncbi:MAG: glycosyltransferase family 25 protein [Synechococcales cyanobacterium RM1_1_8]|nr:glycosyltransferase family 25 protein [Synechococcales cyanobacterium RM1_1_8]